MRAVIAGSLLLCLTSAVTAMDPPAVEWERLYGSVFLDVQETYSGDLVVAGRRWCNYARTIFLYSLSGEKLWESSVYPYNHVSFAVIQLESGDFIATGYGTSDESSSQYSLSIYKVSSDGQTLWSKVFELEDNSRSYGYSLASLPDGGFAICGEIDPAEGMNQAWILRTDSQGDTLWTREWGWEYNDKAMTVLYIDNGLTVLTHGRLETTSGGPHLVRYDMDGNLLWETAIDFPTPGTAPYAQAMCRASDGGLLVLDNYHPEIAHTDLYGNFEWYFNPPGAGDNYGWSVNTTMDGGILFGGENTYSPPGESKTDYSGMISRHDSLGSELWRDYVYNSGCIIIYSARQLSQGGYIAAGQAWSSVNGMQGFLIKYAPELGVEDAGSLPSVAINTVSPNPVTSSATIEFSLIEDGEASLTLYDLNGRVVEVITRELFSEGQHTMQWTPGGISSGCYLLRLSSANGSVTRNVVFLK